MLNDRSDVVARFADKDAASQTPARGVVFQMRRILFRIVLLLVIGAVINVAVAWGLAVRPANETYTGPLRLITNQPGQTPAIIVRPFTWTNQGGYYRRYTNFFGETWILEDKREPDDFRYFGKQAIENADFNTQLPTWSRCSSNFPSDDVTDTEWYLEQANGWPLRSVCMRSWCKSEPSGIIDSLRITKRIRTIGMVTFPDAWLFNDSQSVTLRRNEVPLIPIWPGFCINTLLYACAAWLVFFAPFTAVRFAKGACRRRRGLCLRCGYDLRGAAGATCPECGVPVRAATAKERGTSLGRR